jgi:chemosensory pili system protein ChpA (sensor histidine kinase/response regulator)
VLASNQSVRVRSQLLDRLVNQAGEVMITRSRLEAVGASCALAERPDRQPGPLRQQLRDIELQAESQMQSRMAQAKDQPRVRPAGVRPLHAGAGAHPHDGRVGQRRGHGAAQPAAHDGEHRRRPDCPGRQARELQRDLLRTRMVEFEGISERLYRVVRQASKETGKQVKLDITGGSIEMDRRRAGPHDARVRAHAAQLRGPRHRKPEVRAAAGKPATGTITISCTRKATTCRWSSATTAPA